MKRKIYETIGYRARLNIPVTIGKRVQRVEFSNGGLTSSGPARFMTCEDALQKALEASPLFNKTFRLKSTIDLGEKKKIETVPQTNALDTEVNPVADTADTADTETLTFSNFNELRDYLVTEHNCPVAEVRTLDLAMATAAKLNLKVEISK